MPPNEPAVFERFEYRGFFGRPAWCRLEVIPLADGRTAVIATEEPDNPGTSVTNVAEHLASFVCDRCGIAPDRLVWVEHYGYPPPPDGSRRERTYDLVTFRRRGSDRILWTQAVLDAHPSGWPGYFEEPDWREMTCEDWSGLGLLPRGSVLYQT